MGGGYKIPRLSVEKTDRQMKEQIDKTDKADKESSRVMTEIKDRVLAARPANNDKTVNFRKRMAPKPFEMAAKRVKAGYSRELATAVSTPTGGKAPVRASLSSVSTIDSVGDKSLLKSEPSDSSDLVILNAALDDCPRPAQSVLSNSSDFEVLVNATQEAERRNYRETDIIESTTSDSSSSVILPAPYSRLGTVVGSKRKLSNSLDTEVNMLCSGTEVCELSDALRGPAVKKSFKDNGGSVGVLSVARSDVLDVQSGVCQDQQFNYPGTSKSLNVDRSSLVPSGVCQDQQLDLHPGIKLKSESSAGALSVPESVCYSVPSGVCQDQQPTYPGNSSVPTAACQDQQPHCPGYMASPGVCQDQQSQNPGYNAPSGVC